MSASDKTSKSRYRQFSQANSCAQVNFQQQN